MYGLSHESHVDVFKLLRMPDFSVFTQTVALKYICTHGNCTLYTPQYDLRSRDRSVIPRVRTKYGERLRTFYVPSILHSLPPELPSLSNRAIRAAVFDCRG